MTYYTVTITDNETKQKTYYCNGIVGSLLDRIESDEFDIDDETLKQTIILLKMLTGIVDEYEASDVTFDRVKLAKGGD